ncbi:MAG: hypothetical protein GY803_17705 [Chloroflexi bacterium]|nr:hypothetical protein [Chloroflexota bacterium]
MTAVMQGNPMPKSYDGYTSCPLITGYGSLMLMEFDYDKAPMESFPFNQNAERSLNTIRSGRHSHAKRGNEK